MSSQVGDLAAPIIPPPRRRVRFSLRGLILATALLCAVLSHVLTSYQLHQVRQEARRLRDELGYLSITDTNKLHAIGLALEEGSVAKRWRWRLHIPAGRQFRVCYHSSDLPEEGVPADDYEIFDADSGESMLSASALREPNGDWRLMVNTKPEKARFGQARSQIIRNSSWLEDDLPMTWYSAGGGKTDSVPVGQPLVLLRVRLNKGTHVTQTPDPNPTDGIVIWIEEVKQP